MLDRHTEADLLASLREAYQEILEGKRAHQVGGAGEGKGQRPVGMGGAGFHGKVGGLGRQYTGDKAAAKKKADAQYKKDRAAAARERAQRRADGEKDNPLQAG